MDSVINYASRVTGVHADLLRIAFCITMSFPLGSAMKRIPSSRLALRDAFSISLGIFYLCAMFKLYYGTLFLLLCSFIAYALAAAFPNHPKMPIVNFYIQLGLMLFTHCREQFGSEDFVNVIQISGSQMIMLQKLTAFCWDVFDGQQSNDKLTETQLGSRIDRLPSFLRYLSWIFFFPTVLTGPSCTFMEYDNWITLKDYTEVAAKKEEKNVKTAHRIPRSGTVLLLKLMESIFWLVFYMQSSQLSSDLEFFKRDWYINLGLLGKIGALYLLGVSFRSKYYTAWLLAEAACIHTGLGFNGINPSTGKFRWDRMRNVSPLAVETAQNFHTVFGNWNISTSKWLRSYVYLRVTPPGIKPGAKSTLVTFLVSALWHGTRPGYYFTFVTGALYQIFGRIYRRQLRPVFAETPFKMGYNIVCFVVTQLALSFAALPFILLNATPSIQAWRTVYFYPLLGMAISWLFLVGPLSSYVIPKLRLLRRDMKKTE